MLVVAIDEKGHVDRDPDKKKTKRTKKNLMTNLFKLILINHDYEEFGKVCAYIAVLLSQLKNKLRYQLKSY